VKEREVFMCIRYYDTVFAWVGFGFSQVYIRRGI
jgi:hypothetical protein